MGNLRVEDLLEQDPVDYRGGLQEVLDTGAVQEVLGERGGLQEVLEAVAVQEVLGERGVLQEVLEGQFSAPPRGSVFLTSSSPA